MGPRQVPRQDHELDDAVNQMQNHLEVVIDVDEISERSRVANLAPISRRDIRVAPS